MAGSRFLVSQRRTVPAASRADYDRAWLELQRAAAAHQAHAWRFTAAADAESLLEFLEFAAARDPRGEPDVAAALRALDHAAGPAAVEQWLEA